jgi:hypothetical protein
LSLDNSQINPVGATLLVPHVGPGGTTIYSNAPNDATYTDPLIENGFAYFSITTSDVVSTGCWLKFNISVGPNIPGIWFLANGTYDDGVNNMFYKRFKGGFVYDY